MTPTQQKLGQLYSLLNKAKEAQIEIVGTHGKHMKQESRKQIVRVWNALDEAGDAIHTVLQLEGIDYKKFNR